MKNSVSLKWFIVATSLVSLVGYLIFVLVNINKVPPYNTLLDRPSVSAMIALSKQNTLVFLVCLLLHAMASVAYLEFVDIYVPEAKFWLQRLFVKCTTYLYLFGLLGVAYFPLTEQPKPHNAFAVSSFVLATMATYLHRQTPPPAPPCVVESKKVGRDVVEHHVHCAVADPRAEMERITTSVRVCTAFRVVFAMMLVASGLLFWFDVSAVFEYLLIGFILAEKAIKVSVIEHIFPTALEGTRVVWWVVRREYNEDGGVGDAPTAVAPLLSTTGHVTTAASTKSRVLSYV